MDTYTHVQSSIKAQIRSAEARIQVLEARLDTCDCLSADMRMRSELIVLDALLSDLSGILADVRGVA